MTRRTACSRWRRRSASARRWSSTQPSPPWPSPARGCNLGPYAHSKWVHCLSGLTLRNLARRKWNRCCMTDAPLESSYGVGACCAGRHQFFILAPSPYHRAWRHSASLMSLERLAKDALRAAGSQRRFDVAGKARRAAEIDASSARRWPPRGSGSARTARGAAARGARSPRAASRRTRSTRQQPRRAGELPSSAVYRHASAPPTPSAPAEEGGGLRPDGRRARGPAHPSQVLHDVPRSGRSGEPGIGPECQVSEIRDLGG